MVRFLTYFQKWGGVARNTLWTRLEVRVLVALLIIIGFFTSFYREFIGPHILPGILLTGSTLGIMAIGMSLLIISGEIDLSVASVYGWGVFLATIPTNMGLPFPLSVLIALAFGCLVGFLNGFITLKFKIPSFITTLASMWILRGIEIGIFGQGFFSYKAGPSLLLSSLSGKVGLVPKLFFWFLGLAVIFSIVLTRTKFGNWVFAVGGDKETARALGVRADRVKMACFMITSTLAAFAGVTYLGTMKWFMSRVGMTQSGYGLELETICVAIMGGTSFFGGVGSIPAVGLAALAFSSFKNGFILMGISSYWLDVFTAILLIIFVILHTVRKR